ncbi:MAG: hypothetical protein ACE5FG_03250 [Myxococcota bacterium]
MRKIGTLGMATTWTLLLSGTLALGPLPARAGQASVRQRLEQLRKQAEAEEKREAEWRERYRKRRKALQEAERRIAEAEEKATFSNRALTRRRIEAAERDLTQARQALDELYEEARKNDVPPGWLRE